MKRIVSCLKSNLSVGANVRDIINQLMDISSDVYNLEQVPHHERKYEYSTRIKSLNNRRATLVNQAELIVDKYPKVFSCSDFSELAKSFQKYYEITATTNKLNGKLFMCSDSPPMHN